MLVARGALVVAALVVVACKPDRAETATPDAVVETEPQHASIDCPDDALQRGAAPPDGSRIWCETAAGVSHGPFRSWFPGGQRKTEGTFLEGNPEGEWTSWYADGQLRSRGRYESGAPVGEWEKFDPDGTPAPVEAAKEQEPAPEQAPSEPPVVTGIRMCDLYIDRYTACVETNAPEAVRAAMRDAMQKTVETWKQAAAQPGVREALEQGCTAAYDAVKRTAEGWGCEM
jgi:hypothetical protein